MSNCETFNLPALEVEPHQVREALRCLVHTILFNRALGYVKPHDVDSELFDITYAQCGDPEVERQVETKINQFCALMEKRPTELGQLNLSFFERRPKQAWFGRQDERLYWEQWCINISVMQPDVATQQQVSYASTQARQDRQARQQAALEELLACIIRCVNDKRDHIPPVVSSNTITFPFDITVSGASKPTFGLNAMKKMLMQTTPPPMLS